jgi:hypothetical protein
MVSTSSRMSPGPGKDGEPVHGPTDIAAFLGVSRATVYHLLDLDQRQQVRGQPDHG